MLPLVSHVNRDHDLIEAWIQHYTALGVSSFHLVAHGGRAQNEALFRLVDRYPIVIEDEYTGTFDPFEKRDRLMRVLGTLSLGWVVLVDSDEFLEVPYRTLTRTISVLDWLRADTVFAPFLQRYSSDGSLRTAAGASPFDAYPWCSTDLYTRLGQPQARTEKYPLFRLRPRTALRGGGNHHPPNGPSSRIAPMRGVTHHFKWRAGVQARLAQRAGSEHPYRDESIAYLRYLDGQCWCLPTEGGFRYSRRELFRRGLLRRAPLLQLARRCCDIPAALSDSLAWPDRVAESVAREGLDAVALCGAGSGALIFMDALAQRNIRVSAIVDRDARRWGDRVRGVTVSSLDEALRAGHRAFVAGSLTYAPQMAAEVRSRGSALGVDAVVFAAFERACDAAAVPASLAEAGTSRESAA